MRLVSGPSIEGWGVLGFVGLMGLGLSLVGGEFGLRKLGVTPKIKYNKNKIKM